MFPATDSFADPIVETIHEPLLVFDEELHVRRANPSFRRTFRVAEEDESPVIRIGGEGTFGGGAHVIVSDRGPGIPDPFHERIVRIFEQLDPHWTGREGSGIGLAGEAATGEELPDLVLLDLNLPGKSGHQLLEEIKSDPDLGRIPVVILTSSEAEEDVANSYDRYANAYVTRPVDLDGISRVIRSIDGFWFDVVRLPEGE